MGERDTVSTRGNRRNEVVSTKHGPIGIIPSKCLLHFSASAKVEQIQKPLCFSFFSSSFSPVKIAYSRPLCRANPFAKRVLPVPGGPYNSKWRKGARLRLVLAVEPATDRSLASTLLGGIEKNGGGRARVSAR